MKANWELIQHVINKMKCKFGAQLIFFENDALTRKLPYCCYLEMSGTAPGKLRLYCLWLSESVVVLLNGDQRTNLNINKCPKCFAHFDFARKADQGFSMAIDEGRVRIDEETKTLIMGEDFKILL
ncbi:MAG: hypothetical protein ABI581_14425 [Sediminibacterium sp.]